MRLFFSILAALITFSALQAQELVRGSYHLKVEEGRNAEASIHLTLTDKSATILYQIDRPKPYDTPRPAVHLYVDGSVLLVDSFAGVYERYGDNGRMLDRVPFQGKIHPDHERIVFLSGNDSVAVLLISEPGDSRSRILVLDEGGTIKLDRSLNGAFGSGLLLSPDGRLIAAGTYSWRSLSLEFRTEFLGIDGTSVALLDQEFKGGSWSLHSDLFVLYGRTSATLFDVPSRQIVSTSSLGENRIVHSIVWDGSIPLVAASPLPKLESGAWIYPRFTVMNLADGTIVYQSIASPFMSAKLERTADGVSVRVDGQSVRIR